MQQFKIPLNGIKEIQKKVRFQTILVYLLVTIAGIVMAYKNFGAEESDASDLPIIITSMVTLMSFAYFRGIKRFRTTFATFVITITDNVITREQMNTTTLSIAASDIKDILKDKHGNLEVRDKGSRTVIYAPAQIDNYAELEALLTTFKPIVAKDHIPILQRYPVLGGMLTVGLMVSVVLSTNKIVVALAGTGFVALMAWAFYETYRSQHIDSAAKKRMYWGLLVVGSIFCTMVFKLTGTMGY